MSPLTRLASVAALVALSAGVLGHTIIQQELIGSESTRTPTVDEQLQALKERIAKKQQIAEDLIAGRLTVPEAASRLAGLPLPPAFWRVISEPDPNATTQECLCRHIIDVALDLVDDSSQADALKQRFEREVQQARDEHGDIVLPTPLLAMHVDSQAVLIDVDPPQNTEEAVGKR